MSFYFSPWAACIYLSGFSRERSSDKNGKNTWFWMNATFFQNWVHWIKIYRLDVFFFLKPDTKSIKTVSHKTISFIIILLELCFFSVSVCHIRTSFASRKMLNLKKISLKFEQVFFSFDCVCTVYQACTVQSRFWHCHE